MVQRAVVSGVGLGFVGDVLVGGFFVGDCLVIWDMAHTTQANWYCGIFLSFVSSRTYERYVLIYLGCCVSF